MPQPAIRPRGAAQLAAQNRSPESKVAHWFQPRIDALRWDQSFPFQLLVLRQQRGGAWTQEDGWSFTLPIPPRSLRISMAAPTELHLNEDGATELTNGVRLRTIQLAGTTGVLPLRPSAPLSPVSSARSIFAGTINRAVNGVSATAQALARDISPSNFQAPNILSDADIDGTDIGRTSGYYQFLLLEQFLERYFAAKSTEAGKDLQLAFAIWKMQAVHLVSLLSFDLERSAPNVLRWDYSLAFSSFGRVSLDQAPAAFSQPQPLSTNPDLASRLLNGLRDARRVIAQSRALIQTAVADISRLVEEPMREASLLLTDAAASSTSLSDLPTSIIASSKIAIISLLSARDAAQSVPNSLLQRVAAVGPEVDQVRQLGALLARSDTRTARLLLEGPLANSPANTIFTDPGAHFAFFSALRPGDLRLSSTTLGDIATERARVAALGRADLEERRALVQLASDSYAAMVGLSPPTYQANTGQPFIPPTREATEDDYAVLFALNQATMVLDALAAGTPAATDPTTLALEYMAGLASASGIAFRVPRSKFAIPYPHGATLEELASRHLGDPDRWHEIAALNGLRDPYVDEKGVDMAMVAAPLGNQITLGLDADFVRIGQPVLIRSRTVPQRSATVLSKERAGSTYILTLNIDCSAYIHGYVLAFSPDTVHAGQTLWIPSDADPAQDDFSVQDPATAADADVLLRTAGTDWLLTQEGDLVITPDGDCRYARGLALVTQSVRLAIATPRGSLIRHPSFGLPPIVGESLSDVDPQTVAQAVRDTFADDPLFRAVESVSVDQNGAVTTAGVSLSVRGMDRPLPISFQLTGR